MAETPSNLFEYHAWDYRVLKKFARHYSTGDIIPEKLVESMQREKKMFAAMELQQQIFYALVDQTLYGDQTPIDTTSIVADLRKQHTNWKHVEGTHCQTRFSHLLYYCAGYYSYLYAKCFASTVWERVCKDDPLSLETDHESDYERGLYSNLFTAHPPFQIDANFGFCAAIAEMIVQSTIKDLYLLPALPRDKWSNGSVKGLKARGNVTVIISWKEDDLHEFGLWFSRNPNLESSKNQNSTKRVHYIGTTSKISYGKVYTFSKQLRCIKTTSLFDSFHL